MFPTKEKLQVKETKIQKKHNFFTDVNNQYFSDTDSISSQVGI